MPKEGDISAIFNPAGRVRAPSVVVTADEQQQQVGGGVANGPYTSVPQHTLHHADSVGSNQQDQEPALPPTSGNPLGVSSTGGAVSHKVNSCFSSLCSRSARKIYFGVCVTVCVTASWVGATHCVKYLYLRKPHGPSTSDMAVTLFSTSNISVTSRRYNYVVSYNAPFFTTWFCTNWTMLFFPLYFLCRLSSNHCQEPREIIAESVRSYREKGFNTVNFLVRSSFFCILWVGTNYMYIYSLRILFATDVMALFATNVSCVYLLSWVILHEQFVGIRIVAVILCDTGIALLAYMDGITGSPTLGGVVLATCAAAGSAVYKVLFKKVVGDATYGQVAMFFSIIGLLNALLLWPLCVGLYFTGIETLVWERLPWSVLLMASFLFLVANLLGNFSVALTYDLFITLGLITSVPVSAALDVVFYSAHFVGMKLAGMVLIAVGFFLVMFPDNWPNYITRLLRNVIMLSHSARWSSRYRHGIQSNHRRDIVDYRTGYIPSHLRSPSGRVR